jgi:hypothetical protein
MVFLPVTKPSQIDFTSLVDEREGGEQRPQDERRINGDLGEDDAPGGVEEVNRRLRDAQRRCQRAVQHAGRSVKEGEGERHQESRQGDESVDQPGDERRAGEWDEREDQRQHYAQRQTSGGRSERDLGGVDERIEEGARVEHRDEDAPIGRVRVVDDRRARNQDRRIEKRQRERDERRSDPQPVQAVPRRRRRRGEIRHRLLRE